MVAVVGIDPSLTGTGIARELDVWTVRSPDPGDARLSAIYGDVIMACDHDDTFAVVEDLPTHAHGAGKTGMAQGVVRLALLEAEARYTVVTAATLKKFATGKGNATKPDMRMALYQRAGLNLRDDNQVDAWWLRQLGLHLLDHPNRISLPQTHLAALDKVTRP